MTNNNLERISDSAVRVPGNTTLSELEGLVGGDCLPVEPLSRNQSLGDFLLGGGLGFGSMREGRFSSHVFKVKSTTTLPCQKGKLSFLRKSRGLNPFAKASFEYGSDRMGLVNMAYPVIRMMENSPNNLLAMEYGPVEEMVIEIRPSRSVDLWFVPGDEPSGVTPPGEAVDFFFLNDRGASLAGAASGGTFFAIPKDTRIAAPEGEKVNHLWEKRFIEDLLPEGEKTLRVLVQQSALNRIFETFKGTSEGVFFALQTMPGILVMMSGKKEAIEGIRNAISGLPLVFELK